MPAALPVDWAEVRLLACQIGLKEAADRMGIPYEAVRQRSCREQWLASIPRNQPLPPTVVQPVTRVTSAAQAQAQAMREDAIGGRAAALRVTRRALERADRYDDDELMVPEVAGVIHSYVKSAATAGGYGAADAVARVDLRITGDRTVEAPQTVEAEWTECAEEQGFME